MEEARLDLKHDIYLRALLEDEITLIEAHRALVRSQLLYVLQAIIVQRWRNAVEALGL